MSRKVMRYLAGSKHMAALHDFGIAHRGMQFRLTFSGISIHAGCLSRTGPDKSLTVNSSPALGTFDIPWDSSCAFNATTGSTFNISFWNSVAACSGAADSTGNVTASPRLNFNSAGGDEVSITISGLFIAVFNATIPADDFVDGVVASNTYLAADYPASGLPIIGYGGTVTVEGLC